MAPGSAWERVGSGAVVDGRMRDRLACRRARRRDRAGRPSRALRLRRGGAGTAPPLVLLLQHFSQGQKHGWTLTRARF